MILIVYHLYRYDERSWYPLGRPVGTTIYPGLQILSAAVHFLLNKFGWSISLNDVCVYQPAWFAIVTCLFTFGISYEASRSTTAGLASAFIMAGVTVASRMAAPADERHVDSRHAQATASLISRSTRSIRCRLLSRTNPDTDSSRRRG